MWLDSKKAESEKKEPEPAPHPWSEDLAFCSCWYSLEDDDEKDDHLMSK
jgi:hypothetical protein